MRVIALLALLALVACVQEPGCTDTVVCEDGGRRFVCQGSLSACTQKYAACETVPCMPDVTCTRDGATYLAGTQFPADDGCNTCACGDDGYITCTAKPCDGSCTTDADCPEIPCHGIYCGPDAGYDCPPCKVNRCVDGMCALV